MALQPHQATGREWAASFPPPSCAPLSLQVGIQVVSEDLCVEKQWNVCKALATFVAHQEVSKVDGCPSVSVIPTITLSWTLCDPTQVPPSPSLALPAYLNRRSLQDTVS